MRWKWKGLGIGKGEEDVGMGLVVDFALVLLTMLVSFRFSDVHHGC